MGREQMKKITIDKIISECDKSLKLNKCLSGDCFLNRKDEAIKVYLEELQQFRATGLTPEEIVRLNTFEGSQLEKLLAENTELKAELECAKAARDTAANLVFSCTNILDKNMTAGVAERVGATGTVYKLLKSYRGKEDKPC